MQKKKVFYFGRFNHTSRTACSVKKAFENIGGKVYTFSRISSTLLDFKQKCKEHNPDLILSHIGKTSKFQFSDLIRWCKKEGIPVATWFIDALFGYANKRRDMVKDKLFESDLFFTVDSCNKDKFYKNGVKNPIVLKQAILGDYHYIAEPGKKVLCGPRDNKKKNLGQKMVLPTEDIVFWGGLYTDYRKKMNNFLKKRYGNKYKVYIGVGGHHLNNLVANTKIIIGDNYDIQGAWGNRVYQATGRGACFVTPKMVTLDEHFKYNEEIIAYDKGDFKQLGKLLDKYLENDKERNRVKKNGFKRCPLYEDRVKTILSYLENIK